MKNKIIYVFILIFTISLMSSAKKVRGNCGNPSSCSKLVQKCNNPDKGGEEDEMNLPSLGLFFFNI